MIAGSARLVTDRAEMQKIFEAYTQRFASSQSKEKQLDTIKGSIEGVALWEVTVDKISGKAKAKSPFFDSMKKWAAKIGTSAGPGKDRHVRGHIFLARFSRRPLRRHVRPNKGDFVLLRIV